MNTKQLIESSLFLLAGGLVLVLSLFAAHHSQLQAAGPQYQVSQNTTSVGHAWQQWWDRKLPGSVPYTALRAREHMADWRSSDRQDPVVTMARAEDRLLAAQYAFSQGNVDEAVTTAYKAFGYLSMTWVNCQVTPEDCSDDVVRDAAVFSQSLRATLAAWQQDTLSDELHVAITQLLERLDVFVIQATGLLKNS